MALKVSTSVLKAAIVDALASAAESIERAQCEFSCVAVNLYNRSSFNDLNLHDYDPAVKMIKRAYCKHINARLDGVGFTDIPNSIIWSSLVHLPEEAKTIRAERIRAFRLHVMRLPLNAYFFRKLRKLLSAPPDNHA